ncbi:hypothetical protein HHK36_022676 [Tetracentron sinense]|uniref:Myb-like domain-containing protein n=1 Tax=Tetracentron sinense TaxID=13715 RepID=A0A834YNB1_TETSI|nr:hypothetical protein HHK36_022676 [Tetracentron sinense]
MFNGVSDQFQQFIASSTSPPPPLHFSTTPTFDPYSSHQPFQSLPFHQLHHQSEIHKDEEKEEDGVLFRSFELDGVRSIPISTDPWSDDEVCALLRIRSSMENRFPDLTWEHVSRKLADHGFRRSAEKCKQKFEEESRYCNSTSYSRNCRFYSELEALYQGGNPQTLTEKMENPIREREKMGLNMEENSGSETLENPSVENTYMVKKSKTKKRKRYHELELFKGFCEKIVNKMMIQQEELHSKLLEDVKRRDEGRVAREEAWKKQEMDRINKELETRANEQAIACGREAKIIELLNKFTSSPSQNQGLVLRNEDHKAPTSSNPPSSPSIFLEQNPNLDSQNKLEEPTSSTIVKIPQNPDYFTTQNKTSVPTSSTIALASQNLDSPTIIENQKVPTSSALALASQNPNSLSTQNNPLAPTSSSTLEAIKNPNSTSSDRDEYGRRWPTDEVNSLISLRCNFHNSVEDKDGTKGSLWERISQGMFELGYKRSSKRCKEKWENINKYFRKTKDANKKRSLDSKTCPYFHQLSSLYNQGTVMVPSEDPENHSGLAENRSELPENRQGSSPSGFNDAIAHVSDCERNVVRVSF